MDDNKLMAYTLAAVALMRTKVSDDSAKRHLRKFYSTPVNLDQIGFLRNSDSTLTGIYDGELGEVCPLEYFITNYNMEYLAETNLLTVIEVDDGEVVTDQPDHRFCWPYQGGVATLTVDSGTLTSMVVNMPDLSVEEKETIVGSLLEKWENGARNAPERAAILH